MEKTDEQRPDEQPHVPSADEVVAELRKEIDTLREKQASGQPVDGSQEELLKQLVDGLKGKTDVEKYGDGTDYVDEKDLDPDDLLDDKNAVTFFAHKVGYVVVDDLRNGHPLRTPFGRPIIFKYQATRRRQVGKEVELFNFAVYTSLSKKEVKWLKEHTFFGILFFSENDAELSIDARKAAKLAKFMVSLSTMGQYELAKMARDHELPMMKGVNDMRVALANKFAEAEMKQEREVNTLRLKESAAADALLKTSRD